MLWVSLVDQNYWLERASTLTLEAIVMSSTSCLQCCTSEHLPSKLSHNDVIVFNATCHSEKAARKQSCCTAVNMMLEKRPNEKELECTVSEAHDELCHHHISQYIPNKALLE